MNFEFNSSKTARSCVISLEETILISRYKPNYYNIKSLLKHSYRSRKFDGQACVRRLENFPCKKCFINTSTEVTAFISANYANLVVLSCKGPSAASLNFRNILACNLAQKKKTSVAIVVIGVPNHYYLLRFEIVNNMICLIDVYELESDAGDAIYYDKRCPGPTEWLAESSLCIHCCKKTVNSRYCSSYCHRIDSQTNVGLFKSVPLG